MNPRGSPPVGFRSKSDRKKVEIAIVSGAAASGRDRADFWSNRGRKSAAVGPIFDRIAVENRSRSGQCRSPTRSGSDFDWNSARNQAPTVVCRQRSILGQISIGIRPLFDRSMVRIRPVAGFRLESGLCPTDPRSEFGRCRHVEAEKKTVLERGYCVFLFTVHSVYQIVNSR